MRAARQIFLLLFCLIVFTTVLDGHALALDSDGEADGPPPTVSFADQRPLALDKEKVETLLGEKGVLSVYIHNALPHSQPVSLELIGLDESDDPGIKGLFTVAEATHPVGPGATASFDLTLAKPSPDPEEGTYSAFLLASGRSGGLARRELTVTYPPTTEEKAGENSLNPERTIDITMHAVNYLPSLLSSLFALGFFLTVALIVIAVLFRDRLRKQVGSLPMILVGIGVLVGAVSLVGALEDGPWDQPSLHAISSRPIDLAPQVRDGTRGTVSSEDGTIAQLIAAEHELQPENLDGANKYTGKYHLGSEGGKSEAAATVTVRDFWIYAVLTITLGLIIGLLLHRWFQEKRPKAKLRARLELLSLRYSVDLADLEERDKDRPYREISIDGRFRARELEIDSLLDAGETTVATEKLLALGVYVDKFFTLREGRRNLDRAAAALAATPRLELLGIELIEADGYQKAQKILAKPVDLPGLDSDEAELDAQIKEVVTQTELIEETGEQVQKAIRHLLAAQTLDAVVRGAEEGQLATIQKELVEAGRMALQADSLADLTKAEEADDKALRKLLELRDPIVKHPETPDIHRISLNRALMTRFPTAPSVDELVVSQLSFVEEPRPTTPASARILWSVLAEEEPGTNPVHIEDRVKFAIDIEADGPPSFAEVEVDFGDGQRRTYDLPHPGEPFLVSHPYRSPKDATVVVRSVPGGVELGRASLKIEPEPRALELQRRLAENDKVVGRAAFVLAVASGMAALYFTDPSWGQPMDYLGALVWGGATGEGVKFAAALADRVWPVP